MLTILLNVLLLYLSTSEKKPQKQVLSSEFAKVSFEAWVDTSMDADEEWEELFCVERRGDNRGSDSGGKVTSRAKAWWLKSGSVHLRPGSRGRHVVEGRRRVMVGGGGRCWLLLWIKVDL